MKKFDLKLLCSDSQSSLQLKVKRRKDILKQVADISYLKSTGDSYIQLREERWFNIKPALFLGPHLKDVLRNNAFGRTRFRVPEITLSRYVDANVLPHYIIVTRDGEISQDSYEEYTVKEDESWFSSDTTFNELNTDYCIPRVKSSPHWLQGNQFDFCYAQGMPVEEIDSPTLYLMAWHHNNVSHWFLDVFCRMWGRNFIPEKNLKVLVPTPLHPYMKECLNLFGFSDDNIILARKDRVYKFKELYCVSRLASQYNFISPECTQFYDYMNNYVKGFKVSSSKRIYVSRRDTTKRMCVNEEELESILKSKGFKIVQTTLLNLQQRIELFSGASFVAGPCGAGMFHSLFMPSNSTVFVTGTPEMNKNSSAFSYIGTQKVQDVYIFSGKNIDNKNITTDNWRLNIDKCVDAIESALLY